MPVSKLFIIIGAINVLIAVALGAFGAHILKTRIPYDMMAVYQTGIQYHFYHALGLLIVGIIAFRLPSSSSIKWSGRTMLLGIILFSGSLYALSITGIKWLGAITPFGGVAFLIAWALLAIGAWKEW